MLVFIGGTSMELAGVCDFGKYGKRYDLIKYPD